MRVDVQPPDEDPAAAASRVVPRAVDPLHRVRHAARGLRLPLLSRSALRAAVRARARRSVRHVLRPARRDVDLGCGAVSARRRRVCGSAHARSAGESAGSRPRAAARRVALAHGHLRQRADVRAARAALARASARGGSNVRRAAARRAGEDHPELRYARAASRPGRPLDRVPARPARRCRRSRRATRPRRSRDGRRTVRSVAALARHGGRARRSTPLRVRSDRGG